MAVTTGDAMTEKASLKKTEETGDRRGVLRLPLQCFPIVVILARSRQECHDRLVVVRREGQQIAGAARWFCASSEVTGVLAGKRVCCTCPGHLDVIHYEVARTDKIGVGAGNADRQRRAIAGEASRTAGR